MPSQSRAVALPFRRRSQSVPGRFVREPKPLPSCFAPTAPFNIKICKERWIQLGLPDVAFQLEPEIHSDEDFAEWKDKTWDNLVQELDTLDPATRAGTVVLISHRFNKLAVQIRKTRIKSRVQFVRRFCPEFVDTHKDVRADALEAARTIFDDAMKQLEHFEEPFMHMKLAFHSLYGAVKRKRSIKPEQEAEADGAYERFVARTAIALLIWGYDRSKHGNALENYLTALSSEVQGRIELEKLLLVVKWLSPNDVRRGINQFLSPRSGIHLPGVRDPVPDPHAVLYGGGQSGMPGVAAALAGSSTMHSLSQSPRYTHRQRLLYGLD